MYIYICVYINIYTYIYMYIYIHIYIHRVYWTVPRVASTRSLPQPRHLGLTCLYIHRLYIPACACIYVLYMPLTLPPFPPPPAVQTGRRRRRRLPDPLPQPRHLGRRALHGSLLGHLWLLRTARENK